MLAVFNLSNKILSFYLNVNIFLIPCVYRDPILLSVIRTSPYKSLEYSASAVCRSCGVGSDLKHLNISENGKPLSLLHT